MTIEYKSPDLCYEFANMIDPMLAKLVEHIEKFVEATYHKPIVLTSVARMGDPSSNHCARPVRAVDFRSRIFEGDEIAEILYEINKEWIYDPSRPELHCLIHHDQDRGWHFHAQVHPDTKRLHP